MRLPIMRSLLWLMLALCSIAGFAQAKRTVSGIVKDKAGNGISGISYVIKGTKTSGITDALGNFTASVSGNDAVIVFTSAGYEKNEVAVGGSNTLSVTMTDDVKNLNEVVVTGFGVKKQTRKLAYAIQEVKGEELSRAGQVSVVNSLQGKVSCVMINQGAGGPSSSSRIRIRGNSNI